MATRQIKMPRKDGSETDESPSQRQRAESGRYLLQVDRQTKGSYPTAEAVQSAALAIKKAYPVVQVSVYDRVGNTNHWWSCQSRHVDPYPPPASGLAAKPTRFAVRLEHRLGRFTRGLRPRAKSFFAI
jgi:hypothetical protein